MPFELFSDFIPTKFVDPRWVSTAHVFAESLQKQFPLLRFTLKNFTENKSWSWVPLQIAPSLKDHLLPPERVYYWIHQWTCETCHMDNIPQGPHLLHQRQGHEVIAGKVTHRGIRKPWKANYSVALGSDDRLADRFKAGYVIGLTTGPITDPKNLSAFGKVMLLKLKKCDYEAEAKKLSAARYDVTILPSVMDLAVAEFVRLYSYLDPDAFDSEDPVAAELEDQQKRLLVAGGHMATVAPAAQASAAGKSTAVITGSAATEFDVTGLPSTSIQR